MSTQEAVSMLYWSMGPLPALDMNGDWTWLLAAGAYADFALKNGLIGGGTRTAIKAVSST